MQTHGRPAGMPAGLFSGALSPRWPQRCAGTARDTRSGRCRASPRSRVGARRHRRAHPRGDDLDGEVRELEQLAGCAHALADEPAARGHAHLRLEMPLERPDRHARVPRHLLGGPRLAQALAHGALHAPNAQVARDARTGDGRTHGVLLGIRRARGGEVHDALDAADRPHPRLRSEGREADVDARGAASRRPDAALLVVGDEAGGIDARGGHLAGEAVGIGAVGGAKAAVEQARPAQDERTRAQRHELRAALVLRAQPGKERVGRRARCLGIIHRERARVRLDLEGIGEARDDHDVGALAIALERAGLDEHAVVEAGDLSEAHRAQPAGLGAVGGDHAAEHLHGGCHVERPHAVEQHDRDAQRGIRRLGWVGWGRVPFNP